MAWRRIVDTKSIDKKSLSAGVDENLNNADMEYGLDTFNEDCSFVGFSEETPLIICDGVGSSDTPRLASYYLTEILSGHVYDQIDPFNLYEALKYFKETISSQGSSTTCFAIWPKIDGNLLRLKKFQVGDGMAFLVLRKKNKLIHIINLSFAPTHQLEILQSSIGYDAKAMIMVNQNKAPDQVQQVPCQISADTLELPAIYYSLGKEFYQTTPVSLLDDLKNAGLEDQIFYQENNFSLKDVESFSILIGSDGAYDNVRLLDLRDSIQEDFNLNKLFAHIIKNASKSNQPEELLNYEEFSTLMEEFEKNQSLFEKLEERDIHVLSNGELKAILNSIQSLEEYAFFYLDVIKYFRNFLTDEEIIEISRKNNWNKYLEKSIHARVIETISKSVRTSKRDDISLVYLTYTKK